MMDHSKLTVVTLGTAGGPVWWQSDTYRAGISTAVVVEDRVYIVDTGTGVGRQLTQAGLSMANVHAIFLTYMHSDHTVDLGSLALFGIMRMPSEPTHTVDIIGPGDRGHLPPLSSRASAPRDPVFPEAPTGGTELLFEHLMRAYAVDINDRSFDSLRPTPLDWFQARDIEIPQCVDFHPNDNPHPDMQPFTVYEDELVSVRATRVKHAPMAPAFGYRFDTDYGSVVISGDTAPAQNLMRMAENIDLLLHEAVDFDWVEERYEEQRTASARATRDHHYAAHSSPKQAIELANSAGARQLALHHLAPGTTPKSVWTRDGSKFKGRFRIPSDLEKIYIR